MAAAFRLRTIDDQNGGCGLRPANIIRYLGKKYGYNIKERGLGWVDFLF